MWIQKNWSPAKPISLPDEIHLKACNRIVKIHYIQTKNTLRCIQKPNDEWVFYGNIQNHAAIFKKLRWLIKREATQFLPDQLMQLSTQCKLPFSSCTIRQQNTRWGSCSSEKKINLNQDLIFLSIKLVRYVIIHELCHTLELNHSTRFWRLVEKYDPHWQAHRKSLRHAQSELPEWLRHEG